MSYYGKPFEPTITARDLQRAIVAGACQEAVEAIARRLPMAAGDCLAEWLGWAARLTDYGDFAYFMGNSGFGSGFGDSGSGSGSADGYGFGDGSADGYGGYGSGFGEGSGIGAVGSGSGYGFRCFGSGSGYGFRCSRSGYGFGDGYGDDETYKLLPKLCGAKR